MQPITIHTHCITPGHEDGHHETAWTTTTPGLVICKTGNCAGELPPDSDWCIIHARSGFAISFAPDPEGAHLHAADIAAAVPDVDWTASGAGVRAQIGRYGERVSHVINRAYTEGINGDDHREALER